MLSVFVSRSNDGSARSAQRRALRPERAANELIVARLIQRLGLLALHAQLGVQRTALWPACRLRGGSCGPSGRRRRRRCDLARADKVAEAELFKQCAQNVGSDFALPFRVVYRQQLVLAVNGHRSRRWPCKLRGYRTQRARYSIAAVCDGKHVLQAKLNNIRAGYVAGPRHVQICVNANANSPVLALAKHGIDCVCVNGTRT